MAVTAMLLLLVVEGIAKIIAPMMIDFSFV